MDHHAHWQYRPCCPSCGAGWQPPITPTQQCRQICCDADNRSRLTQHSPQALSAWLCREQIDKQRAQREYARLHAAGQTDEAKVSTAARNPRPPVSRTVKCARAWVCTCACVLSVVRCVVPVACCLLHVVGCNVVCLSAGGRPTPVAFCSSSCGAAERLGAAREDQSRTRGGRAEKGRREARYIDE